MDYEKKGALSEKDGEDKESKRGHTRHTRGGSTSKGHPHIHIHSHDAGHSMHVMHPDGSHEMHHFAPGDSDGMSEILRQHMSGGGEGGGLAEAMGGGEGGPGQMEQPEAQAA